MTSLPPIWVRRACAMAAAAVMCACFVQSAIGQGRDQGANGRVPGETDIQFTLVRRDLSTLLVRVAELNARDIVVAEDGREWSTRRLDDCLALVRQAPISRAYQQRGILVLADGQRLPGEIVSGERAITETVAWNHPRLGRMDVPLKLVASLVIDGDTDPPPPGDDGDVIVMTNGDVLQGLITIIADPVEIEITGRGESNAMHVPLSRIAALSMVSQKRAATGARAWLTDGTVIDVKSLTIGDDGFVRLAPALTAAAAPESVSTAAGGARSEPVRLRLAELSALLLDQRAVLPLSDVEPTLVQGTITRYDVPVPRAIDATPPLGASRILLAGPVTVQYTLPAGVSRLAATAYAPRQSAQWGDCELVIRSGDREVARHRINANSPSAVINVALTGRDLTIELTQGENGPVQDQVVLSLALLGFGQPPVRPGGSG